MQTQVIVIGAGPAGLGCAIWLTRLGVPCVVLEKADRAGGLQTLSPYENLWIPGVQGRTGMDLADDMARHALELGVDIRLDCPAVRISPGWHVTTTQGEITAAHLVIATGTRPRAGDFTPSPTVAIGPGTPMEAMAVTGRTVAILGGGDNAFDQARFARDRGGKVSIFTRSAPRAQALVQASVPDARVVTGPYVADQAAMTVNGEPFDVFGVMYGFEAVLPPGLDPAMDKGFIAVDRFGRTSLAGAWACGEVTDYWHACVPTAVAHGVQVAWQIARG